MMTCKMASANAPSVPGRTGSHTSARAVSESARGRMSTDLQAGILRV